MSRTTTAVLRLDGEQVWRAALESAGVTVVDSGPADIVLAGERQLPEVQQEGLWDGRIWAVADGSASPLDLLLSTPPSIAAAAGSSRWVVAPDETTRGLLDAGCADVAKRSVVLPWREPDALRPALAELLARTFPQHQALLGRDRPLKVVVAGHALHFLDGVLQDWRNDSGIELRTDHVASFARQDEAASRAHAEWADVVFCEWASPVAGFYSRHKRPGSRLVVRLHRAEVFSDWWKSIDIRAVDVVVCVSEHYARITRQTTGWPAEKVVVVPNYVDAAVLARPKLPGAEHTLGLMGAVPRRKRLDLALDVVARLRERDERFTLLVKSRPVWDVPYAWRDEEERAAYDAALHRVRTDPRLVDGVVFDAYGPDVGLWLRKIGWMLSTSDDESFHLAPAETMASGGVPVLRDWPGVETIYDPRWVTPTADAMAERISSTVAEGRFADLAATAQAEALERFDLPRVTAALTRLLVG
ncbi:glycosyltransferase involved in cell wall biosynthesis [Motilibacter rhizosphaerae]|uniref:Glycosyltransferase involved in cell wall biosynthesis n=1 Tax=Motilibacter rhizosphaerae TaxID=598652 RepID=A0A4Q7NTQ8_9ACTN|nr:glycosyltransferase family 4 protein [Motilibacter rhizosphaerae]RZS90198.1 glycosyltransferase involved in cell wall biosynthesis [Motilibacter rhizosphaerae]